MRRRKIRYATKSRFKQEEVRRVIDATIFDPQSGKNIKGTDAFDLEFYGVPLSEPLERDLATMVRQKVMSAYRRIMAPCVVEHAGLILDGYESENYPGGLTQPMWDALGPENFVKSNKWAGSRATARAIVGYCDGMKIHCFVGETTGTLIDEPRGDRQFYWDTIFCPDTGDNKTYAEIATANLDKKVSLSQSTKAMNKLLEHLLRDPNSLFADW